MLKKGISGYQLKYFGAFLMLLDHIFYMFSDKGIPIFFTMLGRLVMPIFLFMCAQGYQHTRNRKAYALRLYVSFLLMNLGNFFIQYVFPSDIVLMNNVFGTMFLSVWAMYGVDLLTEKKVVALVKGIGILLLPLMSFAFFIIASTSGITQLVFLNFIFPSYLTVEGGIFCVLLALLFYIFRNIPLGQYLSLASIAVLSMGSDFRHLWTQVQWMMAFAIIPLSLYNGKRGEGSKSFFYLFYPCHIYCLYLLAYFWR